MATIPQRINKGNCPQRELDKVLAQLVAYFENAIKLDEDQPSCCGETTKLRSGYAGGELIWLCKRCASEALDPKR